LRLAIQHAAAAAAVGGVKRTAAAAAAKNAGREFSLSFSPTDFPEAAAAAATAGGKKEQKKKRRPRKYAKEGKGRYGEERFASLAIAAG
jgi:hypothetical protein